tara:strand:- start:539 stop:649 length:111 start_codon:yes stop_codon:yes gene_type:complete
LKRRRSEKSPQEAIKGEQVMRLEWLLQDKREEPGQF